MNKKLLYFLIASICVSLLGIIAVQFFWIRNAFQVKEAQFNRSVNDALGNVVAKMEARENMHYISRNFEGDSIMRIVKSFTNDTALTLKERLDSLLAVNEVPLKEPPPPGENVYRRNPPPPAPPGVIRYSYQYLNVTPIIDQIDSVSLRITQSYNEGLQHEEVFRFEWNDQLRRLDSLIDMNGDAMSEEILLNNMLQAPGTIVIGSNDPAVRKLRHVQPDPRVHMAPPRYSGKARPKRQIRDDNIQKLDNRAKKIQDVIKQMAIELETTQAPIHQRINKKTLQASLGKEFSDKGIDLPFEFAVISPVSDSNHIPIKSDGFNPGGAYTNHKISMFPDDLFKKPDYLLVHFPGQKTHVFKSLALILAGSVLFTLIIIISSGASIVVMIRQKKISDIKTDFINNMTHEFKTPIATISIAADSINNPRVLAEPETIKNFTRIIKEENNRMNTRVEQVLQMALLDSRDFKLHPAPIDMNMLISRVVEHYRLQIEKREGEIITRLEAENPAVEADEDHMRNVLLNLLDNANKYSIIKPRITITSFNRSGKYFFTVEDRGMGMSAETQRRVFEKFYRVTTGNIHNIKGFGLGLSYVRAIVLAHKGDIRLESEIGKGSKFEISLTNITPTTYEQEEKDPAG